jgi:hypothetical protein
MNLRPLQRALVVARLPAATTALALAANWHLVGSIALIAQSVPFVSVNVQPPAPVQIVLFSADAAEKVLTTTNQKGEGTIDGGALGNLGQLNVFEETCGPRKRVLLVAPHSKVPEARQCERRAIGSFTSGRDKTLKAELFTALPRAATIPDPAPSQPAAAAQRPGTNAAATQAARPPVTATTSQPCPPGAGLIGPKLDLPPGGNTFEEAVLLSACTYRGLADTEGGRWKYFKLSVAKEQTLKVTARTRDTWDRYQSLHLRLHGPNGASVGEQASNQASTILELDYKASESGFVYLAVADLVNGAAFQVSIQ